MKSSYWIHLWQKVHSQRSVKTEMKWVHFCEVDTLEEAYEVVKDETSYKILHVTEVEMKMAE